MSASEKQLNPLAYWTSRCAGVVKDEALFERVEFLSGFSRAFGEETEVLYTNFWQRSRQCRSS